MHAFRLIFPPFHAMSFTVKTSCLRLCINPLIGAESYRNISNDRIKLGVCIKACNNGGSNNQVRIEKVNGRKVNGVGVHEIDDDVHKGIVSPNYVKKKKKRGDEDEDESMMSMSNFKLGRFVEDRFVYGQTFVIRSYEIGPDRTATMETLMNLLQETALNHVKSSGLAGDRFGATHEMSLRKLIWVVTRIYIQVEKYSRWGDAIEIDTWVAPYGKNGMRRDWIIRDYNSKRVLTRATSTWVVMNRETRRLSKMPQQVREEVKPFFLDRRVFPENSFNNDNIDKITDDNAQKIRSGLAPRWNDMDANQHVNNVKYIGWIFESVPINVLEDYQLKSMMLEYRRECRQSNLLESLTNIVAKENNCSSSTTRELGSTHLLRLQQDKSEIVRARAQWQRKEQNT